ncbi:hypothetical protein Baya_0739 [Bagarius yarrelli]|uniref:Uncharacterized protein n=1 Tax=Bagarius yarrelli TaxID=175774 RepID=A0A556TJ46_BAGYA|nr:hypothetical protein Baya_0739 [Bagarius yarrelli]
MLPLLVFLLSLQSLNQLAAAASEGYLQKVKEGLDEEPITAVNETADDYYGDTYGDETNSDWLNEFIEEEGNSNYGINSVI